MRKVKFVENLLIQQNMGTLYFTHYGKAESKLIIPAFDGSSHGELEGTILDLLKGKVGDKIEVDIIFKKK